MHRAVTIAFMTAAVWGGAVPAPTFAQVGCSLNLDQRVLELGEMVRVELVCVNTPYPSAPETTVPQGLQLRLTSATPSQRSQTSIINGRVSRESRYTFSLQLTGTREGTYTLGPIMVKTGDTTYPTDPIRIVVRRTEVASGADGDRRVFVEVTVEPTSLYVTQTYEATLVIGVRKVRIGDRNYDVDMLRQVLNLGASQLSVFSGGQARQSERILIDANDDRHRYVIYRVTQRVRADEIGSTRVGPVFIKARYPTAVRRNVFGRVEFSRTENEIARADAVTVTVKGPPVEGRPDSFTGAIGRYLFDATVRPTRCAQGDPVTLTITIRGGPLEGVAGPDLTIHPELASRFDFTNDELVGDLEGGAKTFRRAIFPKQAGDQTVPPIEWSYFDPSAERYVTLLSQPIAIAVDQRAPGSETSVRLLVPGPVEANEPTLTVVSDGLSANYVDPAFVLADRGFSITSPSALVALVLSPLFCAIVTLTSRHRARLRGDTGYARRRQARIRSDAIVRRALSHDSPAVQWSLLGQALTCFVSDWFNLPSGTLTPIEARAALAANGVDESLADEIAEFLSTCDAIQYAPGQAGGATVTEISERVQSWIKRIGARA